MKKIVMILSVFLILGCSADDKTDSPSENNLIPTDLDITFTNNYGVPVILECWIGTDLDYEEGTVIGNNLQKIYSPNDGPISNGISQILLKLKPEQSILIIVGIPDSSMNVYLNHTIYSGLAKNTEISLNNRGELKSQ
jgi:hypothetical protein